MKFTLLIPTLNEIDGMKAVMPRIKKEWVDEILVIDAKSNDGTFEYAKSLGCKVLTQESKGLTNAYRDAIPHAIGDVIITFSPDGNSIPELIPKLVAKMKEGYDMVIASRYYEGAKSEDDDPITAFGNWLFTTMINVCFGSHLTDSLVIYRAWKKELFKMCEIDPGDGGPDVHMSIIASKYNLKVAQISGDEPKRIGGVRKMSPLKNGFGVLMLIIKEFIRPKKPLPIS